MITSHVTTEEEAARIALSGSVAKRLRVGATALRRLLADPDDTKQVFLLGIVANGPAFPQFLARFTESSDGARVLAERPTIDGAVVKRLRALPASTLGGAYARYLDDNGLDADLFQAPPGLPEPIAYIAKRVRQTHDLWHVLTGYDPDVPGEVALQGFTFAQTRLPSSGLIALLGTLKWAFARPDMVPLTLDGFRRGKEAAFLAPIYWEDHFERTLDDVRKDVGIAPPKAQPKRPWKTAVASA